MYYVDTSFGTIACIAEIGVNDDDGQVAHLDELDRFAREYHRRGHRCVLIIDTRHVDRLTTASQRRRLADWLRERQDLAKSVVVGTCFIISSSVLRGSLTAFQWFGVLPPELTVSATFDEALTRAQVLLSRESLPLHPALARPDAEQVAFPYHRLLRK